jgi:hypothetical protein
MRVIKVKVFKSPRLKHFQFVSVATTINVQAIAVAPFQDKFLPLLPINIFSSKQTEYFLVSYLHS